jgi:hypothetical protein
MIAVGTYDMGEEMQSLYVGSWVLYGDGYLEAMKVLFRQFDWIY